MNAIFFYNLTAENGWRWRFEIITSHDTLLSSPQYVEIPEGAITSEVVWQSKFPNTPIGLPDTPSVKMTFRMDELGSTPALQYLRGKLDSPFQVYEVSFGSTADSSYTVYDPNTDSYITIDVAGKPPAVSKIRLSNVLRVMTDYGNPNIASFDELRGTNANAENSTIVFSGVQTVEPPSEYNHKTKTLTIEFLHLNRYVLQQVNASMIDAQIKLQAPFYFASAILASWKDPNSAKRVELHLSSGDDKSYLSQNIAVYPVAALFTTLSTVFNEIRKYLLRQTGFTWNGFTSYMNFARFYKQNLDNGLQGAALSYSELYFVGRVFPPSTDGGESVPIGGMFAAGSKFMEYKNMFDFLLDLSECCTKELYRETVFAPQLLKTGLELPPNGIEELTTELLALGESSLRQFGALGGYETAVAGGNITASDMGRAGVDQTYNFIPYFHNVFQGWEYSYCPDNGTTSNPIRGYDFSGADKLEGQIFYVESNKLIAAHPACDFENETGYAQDTFNANTVINPETFGWLYPKFLGFPSFNADEGFERIAEKWNEYVNYWRTDMGLARLLGYEIVANLSSDKQRKFSADCRLQSGAIVSGSPVTDISMPFPRNIGRKYTIASDLFDSWISIPTSRVYLISSELDVVKGISKNDFFAQDLPIIFIPI